jgi:ATP-dependent RNA helicase SUPV3L1/SUV3
MNGETPVVTAVLGPTNTGKTHLAIERMLGHASGVIGFPLRLLARENYDRICKMRGPRQVALITGEEKIIPKGARWYVCTVEAMPVDLAFDFLAIDEIQLCADRERGHVFTDRLLHARGTRETMFLGAETMRPVIRRLAPEATFETRNRLSTLRYSGSKKISRLPPRTAIVAFGIDDVYAIAELIRRQRGGAAIVMGALSPRTRNAQVAMFQEGEVDYLVATDAIGMGLNMAIDHVAFAGLSKFDGRRRRHLNASELAQIAGRAGRSMNDGTFGVTGDAHPIDADLVSRIESHEFDPERRVFWRNSDLDFSSTERLLQSLTVPSPRPELRRAGDADDVVALQILARDPDIRRLAGEPELVRLLWDVCQIPDFRKVMGEAHGRMLGRMFTWLADGDRVVPEDWLANQIDRLDRDDGDISTLMGRIAGIRTWTYVSYRNDWLDDAETWRERSRAVEDKLSDALHDRLTQRFVDKRTAHLVRRLNDDESQPLLAAVAQDGAVTVEGHHIGQLDGFRFRADEVESLGGQKTVANAAKRALRNEIRRRINIIGKSAGNSFSIADDGTILWDDNAVAQLVPGRDILSPDIRVFDSDLFEGDERERILQELRNWLKSDIEKRLAPLLKLRDPDPELRGAARGLAWQMSEHLGALTTKSAGVNWRQLTEDDRKALARHGIRFGLDNVYMPALLKPDAIEARALLWCCHHGDGPALLPPEGRVSFDLADLAKRDYWRALGFAVVPHRGHAFALRMDMLERISAIARRLGRKEPFSPSAEMASLAGVGMDEVESILRMLGFRSQKSDDGTTFTATPKALGKPKPERRRKRKQGGAKPPAAASSSPFAILQGVVGR